MLEGWLRSVGFSSTLSGDCIYRRVRKGSLTLIALPVDDQIIASSYLAELKSFRKEIDKKYGITYNGELSDLLGMRTSRDRPARKLLILQEAFVENLTESFGMSACNFVQAPLPPKFVFHPSTPDKHTSVKDKA
jgi:hypothetical protein